MKAYLAGVASAVAVIFFAWYGGYGLLMAMTCWCPPAAGATR